MPDVVSGLKTTPEILLQTQRVPASDSTAPTFYAEQGSRQVVGRIISKIVGKVVSRVIGKIVGKIVGKVGRKVGCTR